MMPILLCIADAIKQAGDDLDLDLIPETSRVTFTVFTSDQFFVTAPDTKVDRPPVVLDSTTTVAPPVDKKQTSGMVISASINGHACTSLQHLSNAKSWMLSIAAVH